MNLPDNSIHLQLPRPVCEAIIRPVPEHRADQELSEIYRDLKGHVRRALGWGHHAGGRLLPALLCRGMATLRPSAKTHFFERASDDIRIRSWELMGQSFVIEGQTDRLREMGYSVREIGQIRAVLDIFDYGNPKYLIFATAIKEGLLSGRTFGGAAGDARCHFPRSPICQIDPIPVMVEEHHAGGTLSQVYADIKQTLQLPFINSDYKAMARWPSYLEQAWGALKPCIDTPAYQAGRFDINARALAALDALPTAYRMSRDDALQAGLSEAQTDELIQVISLFQWMLSGLVLNVTHFKQQALK
nr:D-2-haloalkanoate dehalogenase [Pseudomonas putida]